MGFPYTWSALELTMVNGISIDKKHYIGIGGGIWAGTHPHAFILDGAIPLYANYRLYFQPDAKFSPHINVAIGTQWSVGYGFYSSFACGFRVKKFSLSCGIPFMTIPCVDHLHYLSGFFLKLGFVF
jgi:hypothetical protein